MQQTEPGTDAQPRRRAGASTVDDRELRLLHDLSAAAREMHRSLSLDDVLQVATERAREIVGATQAVTIQTTNQDWANAVTAVSVTAGGAGPPLALVPPSGPAALVDVCQTNRPMRLSEVELQEPPEGPRRSRDSRRLQAWMAAPLVGSDGRNLGLIQLARVDGDYFTAADEAIIVQLAGMASVAIENARLYEAAVDARAQLAWAAHIERVRAAELHAVIEAMGEAVLVCDASGRVSIVNPAAETLFRESPVVTYDDLLSRFVPLEARDLDPTTAGPVEVRVKGGRPDQWIELRVYPVPGVSRRPGEPEEDKGRIAVMRDVTAARRARAQREAFLGILSHELRTPITTIYAGSKVLAREEPLHSTTRHELAADISAEAERLFRLVEDLLVMTRVERGVLQLANEPVLLQRVLAAAIRLEAAHWPTTRIQLTGPADLPAVAGDATYVEQVIRNLLSNAAKYSPRDARVKVRLEDAGDEVVVRVLDRGRGFQSDETDDLFELFYRSPATAAQASGAGIGLFVCRRLITAMGGRIWAHRRPGGGAEFGFALQRYQNPD
jgi:signal transduction histidine kinase